MQTTSDFFDFQSDENQQVYSDEALNQLHEAIKQLSKIDRAVIILHLEQHSHKEIASILNTSANNIGVRISRIKKKLKSIIKI